MTPVIAEGRPGVFIVDRRLLAGGRVWGRWFFPHAYADGQALEKAIESFLAYGPMQDRAPMSRKRQTCPGRPWVVLDAHAVDSRLMTRANPRVMVTHARACRRFGLPAVRAFHAVYHRWPTVADMQATFVLYLPTALYRVARYLRRRQELAGWRQPLKSPAGRAWLARQALAILGRKYVVHLAPAGGAWLFRLKTNVMVRRARDPRRPGRQS